MDYQINFAHYKQNFSLPSIIMEGDFKKMDSDYLKVILFIFRNPDKDYSCNLLSNLLALSEHTVKEALHYWMEKGVLLPGNQEPKNVVLVSEKSAPMVHSGKVTQDAELQFLLSHMETILKRPATSADLKTITYIYEYYRLPADVILMAIQYAVERGRNGIKYIESVCIGWYDQGITNHTMAEAFLQQAAKRQENESKVKKLFGISERKLIASEEKYIETWFNQYQFDLDMIELAYERTIKNTGKLAFAYLNKILANWYQKGYRSLQDVLEKESGGISVKKAGNSQTSYDMDAFEKHLNKVPTLD